MTQIFRVHPVNPQTRLIKQAVNIIRNDGIIAYPTDSCYALGCQLGNQETIERICKIRNLDRNHNMTLMCEDLSNISRYARLDNTSFRLMKSLIPGPYTFILKASRDVPRKLQHPKRKTIGIRIPDNKILQAILHSVGDPLISTSLILPGETLPLSDPDIILAKLGSRIELVIDGGYGEFELTTVIDLIETQPDIVRRGKGILSFQST